MDEQNNIGIPNGYTTGQQATGGGPVQPGMQYYIPPTQKKSSVKLWLIPLIIFVGLVVIVLVLTLTSGNNSSYPGQDDQEAYFSDYSDDYIGVLYIDGTIASGSADMLAGESTYNHEWTMACIDEAISNPYNKGLVLFVNTPGGGVYESDELYLKLKEYKETGKPLYSAMGSMAASGGYYISAPADKIIANRNCWTGSIGVTIGTLYDVSGLLDKYGIKSVTIASGKNKAMGGYTDPLTKEQQAIFQSLVDESYDQFVSIVAEGRKMPVNKVKQLADGRIYTAKQALANGLIDQIGTLEEATQDMQDKHDLSNCEVIDLRYIPPDLSMFDSLLMQASSLKSGMNSDVTALLEMMNKRGEIPISYMSDFQK